MHRKPRAIPNPRSLSMAALDYLARFAASEQGLRQVLTNRVARAARDNPDWAQDRDAIARLHSEIETIIETHKKSGAVNDAAFAEIKVTSLRRQGRSKRVIEQKLAQKGVRGDVLAKAFAQHDDGRAPDAVDYAAAMALARRRKLGPYRTVADDTDRRRKEFATLARAGFSSSIAQRVLKAEPPEEWE